MSVLNENGRAKKELIKFYFPLACKKTNRVNFLQISLNFSFLVLLFFEKK